MDRCLRASSACADRDALELLAELEALHDVFLPGASFGGAKLEPSDVDLAAASFGRVTLSLDAFTTKLYQRLFAEHPRLRSLFPHDLGPQRQKLGHALKLAVDSLRAPARLSALLEDLGRTHLRLGVTPDDLALLGEHLLETLREIDAEHWNEALRAAWTRAWKVVLEALLRGYDQAGRDALRGPEGSEHRDHSQGSSVVANPAAHSLHPRRGHPARVPGLRQRPRRPPALAGLAEPGRGLVALPSFQRVPARTLRRFLASSSTTSAAPAFRTVVRAPTASRRGFATFG